MRELAVSLKFTSPCLGNVKRQYRRNGKIRHYFVLPRDPSREHVVFMPTWWQSTLRRAAEVLCRHQSEVDEIRFAVEVVGDPRPVPTELYRRYYNKRQFSKHEAFLPGDVITVTCIVPSSISDDDFLQLMRYAGRYCGISPAHPNEFGFYDVESIRNTLPPPSPSAESIEDVATRNKKAAASKETAAIVSPNEAR